MKRICHLFTALPVLLLPVLLLSGLSSCKAQTKLSTTDKKAAKLFEDGRMYYMKGDLQNAEQAFVKAVGIDPRFKEAYMLLGDIEADKGDLAASVANYKKAVEVDPEFFPKAHLIIGNIEKKLAHFEEAEKYYLQYLQYADDTMSFSDTRTNIIRVRTAAKLMRNPVPFVPKNLGPNINTPDAEYQPSVTADEQLIVFTRLIKTGPSVCASPDGRTEDFFYAGKNGKDWSMAQNMGRPLNTDCNEGAQALSPDGRYMFFTACHRQDGLGRCDLYWAKSEGKGWGIPDNLGVPVNSKHWETQPSFSSDGKTLYFASNMPGGLGKSDLWKSVLKDDGTWTIPENLGPKINTPGDENSPFIHPDDQTLYFASDFHPGMGGIDLFYARKNAQGKFESPINLGYPINTTEDERSLMISTDGRTAYYASKNLQGMGDYDLYSFDLYPEARPQPVTYMKGRVSDAQSKKMLEAQFELIDLKTGEVIVKSMSDKVSGEFLVCIPANRDYALNVSRNGYLFYSENFSLKESKTINEPVLKNVELTPIQKDVPVVLRNIFFETGSAELKPESRVELDKLVDLLKKNPSMKIEISGHTDNVGSKESNLKLSDNRAKSVSTYLTGKGIVADRLSTKGYGDSKPIDDNTTEQGRANNRRTEFKVTQI